ncbi:MAG: Rap1a/Tai family immunity protein [Kiloniellaceae bacterium]
MRRLGLVLALLLISRPVSADYHSARDFSHFCFMGLDTANTRFRLGYIVGVAQVLNNVTRSGGSLYGQRACLPLDLNQGQASAVVRKFLDGQPGLLHLSPDRLIAAALSEAFPCD